MLILESGATQVKSIRRKARWPGVHATVVTATLLTAACGSQATNSGGASDNQTVSTHRDYGAATPGSERVTPGALLNLSLSYPGMHGVVRGIALDGGSSQVYASAVRTAYRFKVESSLAATRNVFLPGAVIRLVVPGGKSSNGVTSVVEGAPHFQVGHEYYVWVQDQPASGLSGPLQLGALPVPDLANTAAVGGNRVTWLGAVFDRGVFEATLRAHPART